MAVADCLMSPTRQTAANLLDNPWVTETKLADT